MSLKKTHILIVDDEPLLRRSFGRLLRSGGYSVLSYAENASQAAEIFLRDESINIVLSDVQMSVNGVRGEDGTDLFVKIHPALERRGAQFIAMTGSSDPKLRSPFLKHGIPVLSKPFDVGELLMYLK